MGLIDIHCHILPCVDDGAADLESSVEIARALVAEGIECVVATPHTKEWAAAHAVDALGCSLGETQSRVSALQHELDSRKIPIRVLPGSEAYVHSELAAHARDGKVVRINGSRYLLLELPLHDWPFYLDRLVFDLQIARVVPIIAHPERYGAVQKDPSLLLPLIERGCLCQLTAGSLVGAFGSRVRNTARHLLDQRMAHVIASDTHSVQGRSPLMAEARRMVEESAGVEAANDLFTRIPGQIVDDQPISVARPSQEPASRSFFGSIFRRYY